MAYYAHLDVVLQCPHCGTPYTTASGLLWFQWGFCPSYAPHPDFLYHLGDSIHWRTCADGSTPAWTYFSERDPRRPGGGNIGDPTVADLIVQDQTQFYWENESERRYCGACHQPLDGAVIEIRRGLIARAWIYQPGEFERGVAYYVVGSDGAIRPMPDWEGRRMAVRQEC